MEEFNYMCNEDIIRTITGTKVDSLEPTLTDLSNMSVEELTQIKGIGKATAKKLLAAFELGRRMLSEHVCRINLSSSIDVYNYLHPTMSHLDHEEARLLIMNNNFCLLKDIRLSIGGLTETSMDVRQIMKQVVLNNGAVIALAHNHPSNNPTPSKNDDHLTFNISKACDVMRIFLSDHIIIADDGYYSYKDKGRL